MALTRGRDINVDLGSHQGQGYQCRSWLKVHGSKTQRRKNYQKQSFINLRRQKSRMNEFSRRLVKRKRINCHMTEITSNLDFSLSRAADCWEFRFRWAKKCSSLMYQLIWLNWEKESKIPSDFITKASKVCQYDQGDWKKSPTDNFVAVFTTQIFQQTSSVTSKIEFQNGLQIIIFSYSGLNCC